MNELWKQNKIVIRIQEVQKWLMIVFYCFLSKKQAINYCSKIKRVLRFWHFSKPSQSVSFSSRKEHVSDFSIAIPEFEQLQENSILCYTIPHKV